MFLDYNRAQVQRDVLLPMFSKQAIQGPEYLV
jgi:hypothetical protein